MTDLAVTPSAAALRRRQFPAAGPALLVGAVGAVLAGPLLMAPGTTLAALVAVALVVAVVAHPPVGAYTLLATTPLIVGIDRGSIVPLIRPSEAVAVLVAVGLVAHRLLAGRHETLRLRLTAVDLPLLAVAVASSAWPVLWMVLRNRAMTGDDLLYSLVVWKLVMVFLIVRASIRTEREVRRCLWVSMGAAAIVAVIAILQSLNLFGVPGLLAEYYAPLGDERVLHINRGTSTLASSLATGDVMAFNLAIALGWLATRHQQRGLVVAAAGVFALGALASGQFSAVIGLVSVVVAVGLLTRRLTRTVIRLLPVGLLGLVLLEPVIERRLAGFASGTLPSSWVGRLYDLTTYFWPELFSDFNFVLGVRPAARLPAEESWRTYVWIESGHTWLLWSGGVLLFAAFFVFLARAMRTTARIARARDDAVGVVAIAAFAALAALAVLMTFDAHLILRGTGELLFSLLALALVASSASATPGVGVPAHSGAAAPAPGGRPGPALPRTARARERSSGERLAR